MLISLNSFAWLDGFYDFVGKNYTFGLVREASFRQCFDRDCSVSCVMGLTLTGIVCK